MCGGVTFNHSGQDYRVFFPNPNAVLPVRMKNGSHLLLPWGRRREQSGSLPVGGWARLDSVYSGVWDKYFPTPVKIDVSSFMEKDYEGKSRWFDLLPGKYIQGLVAKNRNEQRIYVVTMEPDSTMAEFHDRMPRIMFG
ncbi:hypothetical protein BOW35_05910 [Solemya velum gill symbiont]|uniref:Uncharacterized protein n=1 Tax=Solemya velum gill symbiont TaxID=2340 RepID=A0A0B0H9U7_SOVGS|nr:hypothetical protein JV46_13280 [Solemya velum gill symbiont]OOZ19787.1 hypothetical protein BOW29_04970 [Solemya velum gill symbiont]OOZ34251.1 hypothetical protein BOW35_05910 [Solemya velum gill symbiont]